MNIYILKQKTWDYINVASQEKLFDCSKRNSNISLTKLPILRYLTWTRCTMRSVAEWTGKLSQVVEAQKVEIMWPIGCTENKWYCLPVQKLCSFHMCVLCFLRFSPGFYSHQQPINDHGLNLRIWWMKWMKSGDHHLGKYKILWNSRIFATKLSCLTGFS